MIATQEKYFFTGDDELRFKKISGCHRASVIRKAEDDTTGITHICSLCGNLCSVIYIRGMA